MALPYLGGLLLLAAVEWTGGVRVYNALITSQQELLPSRVYPSWLGPPVYLGHHLHPHLQPVVYQGGYELARDGQAAATPQLIRPHQPDKLPQREHRTYQEADYPEERQVAHHPRPTAKHTQAVARQPQRRPHQAREEPKSQAASRQPPSREEGYPAERPARRLMFPDAPSGLPLNNRPLDIPVVPPPPLPIRHA